MRSTVLFLRLGRATPNHSGYSGFTPVETGHSPPALRTTWSTILSIILGYDPATLREQVDLLAAGRRLDELGDLRSLNALNEKVALLRLVGRLDDALEVANEALRQARFTGDRQQVLAARLRRAQVLQYQGKLEEAYLELTSCADAARINDWTRLEAFALQHRGKVLFDQKDYAGAILDLKAAVFLREKLGAPRDELDSSLVAVEVVQTLLDEQRRTS